MKTNPVTLIIENQEIFEYIKPVLNKALNTPQIIHCKTHQDAMDYIASDKQADIIIADWDLTGYIFLDSVRSDLENHNTPVILMSEDTTIKKIVLNNIESKATFFQAKPFLKKGFIKKLSKVLKLMEHRRKNRLHPEKPMTQKIQITGKQSFAFPLVDISIDGCLLRVPIKESQHFSIYLETALSLNIDELNLQVKGEIYRIGHDRPVPEHRDSVLIMMKFTDSEQQIIELQEIIDELGKRWQT